jgi:hypothetical protein
MAGSNAGAIHVFIFRAAYGTAVVSESILEAAGRLPGKRVIRERKFSNQRADPNGLPATRAHRRTAGIPAPLCGLATFNTAIPTVYEEV